MTPTLLRQLWSVIEATQAQILLKLDDPSLVQWLLKQLKSERSLDNNETNILNEYLYSKLTLIRDLALETKLPCRMLRLFPKRSTAYSLDSMPVYCRLGRSRRRCSRHAPSPHPTSSTVRTGQPRRIFSIASTI